MASKSNEEVNPHIPDFMAVKPWYVNDDDDDASDKRSLTHQRKRERDDHNDNKKSRCTRRGEKGFHAEKYRKGACPNCGAMTHDDKSCMERPRANKAKHTGRNIAPDEVIEEVTMDFEAKRDRYNAYDPDSYAYVVHGYEKRDQERKKYVKEQKLEGLLDDDEAKVDESEQKGFGKVDKRVCTPGGGCSGTARDLRIREDTAKYLVNLDVNSAYYDPKARSMRGDPQPDADPNEKFYAGDNENRLSGEALEFKRLHMHALEAFEKGEDVHAQGVPSQAEMLYERFKVNRERLRNHVKEKIAEKYGNAATEEEISRELLLGQSERQVEYDRAGRIIVEGKEMEG